jgi:hypothetical protein
VLVPDIRRFGILAGVALAATLAGCTSSNGGLPGPAGTTTNPGAESTTPLLNDNSSITFAPRPRDLSLASVDPCKLLTSSQRSQFGLEAAMPHTPDQIFHQPSCTYPILNGNGASDYVNTVSSKGIEYWLDPTLDDNLKQVTVGGFPALDVTLKGSDSLHQCSTAVSVGQGQMLIVLWGINQNGTDQQTCAQTEQVAAAALTTLRTMK